VNIGLQIVGLTDPGRMRSQNEDSIATDPKIGIAVLADGMGGHQAGEVASRMAVDVVTHHLSDVLSRHLASSSAENGTPIEIHAVEEAIRFANTAIFEMARARPECAGMGSTIVVIVFFGNRFCVGHVGDSRLYRLRDGTFEQLTQDHSVIQELVTRGLLTHDEARQSIGKNLVTRALGVEATVTADIAAKTLQERDVYLLCSDGLNDVVSDAEIQQIVERDIDDLNAAARKLIAIANERGGPDNISVILICTGSEFQRDAANVWRL
jgi:serine/threonine protein phosphatase PrpC